jgi:hypothetical protein
VTPTVRTQPTCGARSGTGGPSSPCRGCGCTPADPCITEWLRSPGRLSDDPATRLRQRYERARAPLRTCQRVSPDLCSRCLARGVPTSRQLNEVDRLRSRVGPVEILGPGVHGLVVGLPSGRSLVLPP